MARPNSIWKRKQTGWFYVTMGGKKFRLSKDRTEAQRMLGDLLKARVEKEQAEPPAAKLNPLFRKVADQFLGNSQRVNKPNTYRMHRMSPSVGTTTTCRSERRR